MLDSRSYIVRVYQRVSSARVVGVVELVRTGQAIPFRTAAELWAIVNGPQLLPSARKQGRTTSRTRT